MPFFLPSRLIEFEYFTSDNTHLDYDNEAKPYRKDMDFAFFAVNFGYSKSDYESLTPREKAFIYKAWENKRVADSYSIYNACNAAFFNATRSKRQRPMKLFKRKIQVDEKLLNENKKIIMQAEKNDGDWIARIYEANNLPFKKAEKVVS